MKISIIRVKKKLFQSNPVANTLLIFTLNCGIFFLN